jgi:hypothetical protein
MSFINNNNIPLGLAVQRGLVNNFSGVQKFGYNTFSKHSHSKRYGKMVVFILTLQLQLQQ